MTYGTEGQLQAVINDAYNRFEGEDARSMNLEAGRALGEAVRTTLGPNGMDKMLVDSLGGVVVTNDGATILQEMDLDHPGAKLIAEVAKTQEKAAGDGTTTAVVFAGELLHQAQKLIDDSIHPTTIIQGYRSAVNRSYETLDANATEIEPTDEKQLTQLAETAMTGTSAEEDRKHLSELVVEAVQQVRRDGFVDATAIQIEGIPGGLVPDSEVIHGTTIEKEPAQMGMETLATDATIAVLQDGFDLEDAEIDGSISYTDHETTQEILDAEEETLFERVDRLMELGVDVVFAGEELKSLAVEEMVQRDTMVFHKTPTEALERLVAATGATLSTGVDALSSEKLGHAGRVESGSKEWTDVVFIEECDDPDNVTLLLRGGPTHVMDELERPIADAISVVSNAIEDGAICPGGCAIEVEIAQQLRDEASTVGTREQLAIEAFADAIELLPRTLAENAGLDPIDAIVELRRRHAEGGAAVGFNGHAGAFDDTFEAGVVDSLRVKQTAIETAAQAAILLLRIDDMLLSEELPDESHEDTAATMPR